MISTDTLLSYRPQRTFLIQGNAAQYTELVADLENTYEFVHSVITSRFAIEDARALAAFAIEGDGTERVCVVYFSVFSPDAAQVLLKSLEEPAEQTMVVLVTPYPYTVPMTIRSRVALIQNERIEAAVNKLTRAQALDYVKRELSSDADDDAATRRANAVALLDQLEQQCKGNAHKSQTIYEAKHMLFHANMPTKAVMEYVVSVVL